MRSVITQSQAKQITGGRTPNMPVEYEKAVRSLQACIDLDDAKYWSDKADALAAWAKIYRSKEAETKAKRLKLHAFRRMGQLAAELRPVARGMKKGGGALPGPVSILREMGMTEGAANSARQIAKIPGDAFNQIVERSNPPSPSALRPRFSNSVTESWKILSASGGVHSNGGNSFTGFRAWCRRHDARSLSMGLTAEEAGKARAAALEIAEWLDAFEQALPKGKAC